MRGACGVKYHLAEICANVATVFACEAAVSDSDGYKILSGEEKDAFVCSAKGMFFDESGEGSCSTLT